MRLIRLIEKHGRREKEMQKAKNGSGFSVLHVPALLSDVLARLSKASVVSRTPQYP
jgi:hypothetical protein